jgi:Zn-dependent protease with chaperone function
MAGMDPSEHSQRTFDEDGRAILTGISSRAFEHPADRAALTALRSVPGFDQLLKLASGLLRERQYRLAYLASAVRVNERQFSDLNGLLGDVVAVLDAPERPELYVFNNPIPNAITLGVDKPFIAMSSGLYELADESERRFVLGHELGHAMSGHALYQSMLQHLLNLIGVFGWIPGGGLGLRALIAALREWQRKAELSGDRAGLLATQDVDAALRFHMKMAGGAHLDQIDHDAFLAQAAEYEGSGDLRDGVLKLLNTEKASHPFAVVRAAELRRWVESGEYQAVVDGDYPRREDDHTASFSESAREAARSYKKRIDESTDPLVTTVRNIGASVGTAADSIVDWFARRARPGHDDEPSGDTPADSEPSSDSDAHGDDGPPPASGG